MTVPNDNVDAVIKIKEPIEEGLIKELQKLKHQQAKPSSKKQYKNNKHITTFLKSIGAE